MPKLIHVGGWGSCSGLLDRTHCGAHLCDAVEVGRGEAGTGHALARRVLRLVKMFKGTHTLSLPPTGGGAPQLSTARGLLCQVTLALV